MKYLILLFFLFSTVRGLVPYWNHIGSIKSYPHRLHRCDASQLVGPYFITIASCVVCKTKCRYVLTLGSREWSGGTLYNITKQDIHPLYPVKPDMYNIAIIKISGYQEEMRSDMAKIHPGPGPGKNGSIYTWQYDEHLQQYALTGIDATLVASSVCMNAGVRLLSTEICIMTRKYTSLGRVDEAAPFISYDPAYHLIGINPYRKYVHDGDLFAFTEISRLSDWVNSIIRA